MSILALNVHQRHQNDDGSAVVEVDVTTEAGPGVVMVTLGVDDTVRAEITGGAQLDARGLWDRQ